MITPTTYDKATMELACLHGLSYAAALQTLLAGQLCFTQKRSLIIQARVALSGRPRTDRFSFLQTYLGGNVVGQPVETLVQTLS